MKGRKQQGKIQEAASQPEEHIQRDTGDRTRKEGAKNTKLENGLLPPTPIPTPSLGANPPRPVNALGELGASERLGRAPPPT